MLNSIRRTGKTIGRELNTAWARLAEGWRELAGHSGAALTHFSHNASESQEAEKSLSVLPCWGLVAGEVEETKNHLLVRVELPGMEKEDFRIIIEGNLLCISGEKHFSREAHDSTYHFMERAYGAFERTIPLPHQVDAGRAESSYRNGILEVRLPKVRSRHALTVPVA